MIICSGKAWSETVDSYAGRRPESGSSREVWEWRSKWRKQLDYSHIVVWSQRFQIYILITEVADVLNGLKTL